MIDKNSEKCLDAFKKFMKNAQEYNYGPIPDVDEYDRKICHCVYEALEELERNDGPYYAKRAPKDAIMSMAMKICKGSLNPGKVSEMIDAVSDFYYEVEYEILYTHREAGQKEKI